MHKKVNFNSFLRLDLTDAKIETDNVTKKRALLVDLEVSASGKITNGRIYPPKGHRVGIKTWTQPYEKPVQLHHDSHRDPIGRFVEAKWEDTETKALSFLNGNYAALAEIKRAFDTQNAESIYKVMKKHNALSKDWPGLGRVVGKVRITDEDAIEKLLDKRYLTWSAGQQTDSFTCMACGTPWHRGESCEHTFGGTTEDGEPVVFLCGNMSGKEVSVINNPGNDTSITIGMQFEDSSDENGFVIEITDSLDDASVVVPNITLESEKDMKLADLQDLEIKTVLDSILSSEDKLTEFLDALNGDSHYEVKWLIQIHDSLHYSYDYQLKYQSEEDGSVERIPFAVYKLHGALHDISIQKNFRDSMLNGILDDYGASGDKTGEYRLPSKDSSNDISLKLDEVLAFITKSKAEVQDGNKKEEVKEEVLDEQSSKKLEKEKEDEDEIVEDDSIDWETLDLALQASVGEDAKLSTEKRESLAASSFCGPNRSFPVPDCAHVTAARRLIGRAKLSSDQKDKVLSCVNGKAKKLGCNEDSLSDSKCNCQTVNAKYEDLKTDYGRALLDLERSREKLTKVIVRVGSIIDTETQLSELKLDELISWFDNIDFESSVVLSKKEEPKQLKPIQDQKESITDHTVEDSLVRTQLSKFEQTVVNKYNAKLKDEGEKVANRYLSTVIRYLPSDFDISNHLDSKE